MLSSIKIRLAPYSSRLMLAGTVLLFTMAAGLAVSIIILYASANGQDVNLIRDSSGVADRIKATLSEQLKMTDELVVVKNGN